MTGIIALAGGNEFRPDCRKMDERLLSLAGKRSPRVVILPTAAVRGSPRMAAANGVQHFAALGAEASAAMIVTAAEANDPHLIEPVHTADMVYLAGGDPGYLLGVLSNSLLWTVMCEVYQHGGILAGSSAGAMVLSAKMRVWNTGAWVDGLGLAALAILVHHNQLDTSLPQALASSDSPSLPLLGIAESTACFSSDGQSWEVAGIGQVSRYTPAQADSFQHGQVFML